MLGVVSRRSFVKGVLGIGALLATTKFALPAAEPLVATPQPLWSPLSTMVAKYNGMDVVVEPKIPDQQIATMTDEEAFIRGLFDAKGYEVHALVKSKPDIGIRRYGIDYDSPFVSPWHKSEAEPASHYTVAFRHKNPRNPNVSLNYMTARGFKDLWNEIDKLSPMKVYSSEQNNALYLGSTWAIDKSLADYEYAERLAQTKNLALSGIGVEQQLQMTRLSYLVNSTERGQTGFVEGQGPKGGGEFSEYWQEKDDKYKKFINQL